MSPVTRSGGPTCIEGFCGAGGMSLGLHRAGFDVRLAFDNNPVAISTYRRNLGVHGKVMDAWQVTGRELLDAAGLDEVDLFAGGPPCQGFSKQRRGAHLLDDPRNRLVTEFARLVEELKPKAFIFENVEIVGQKRGRELVGELVERLDGYETHRFLVCAADFGLAQTRGRFLLLGFRNDMAADIPVLEKSRKRVTIRDAIGDLPAPPADYREHPTIANHIKCKITKENEIRFSHVKPGGGWQDIPWKLRLPCHQVADVRSGGWPDVYGRLEWNGVCPTLTAGFDSFTRGRYGHPEQNRSLTLREGARLQGFPDEFRFMGNRGDIRLQIGNAVPPPLAQAAGEAVQRALGLRAAPIKGSVIASQNSRAQLSLAV
ncbi:DNA cytosine methyltransferase [Methylorubrum zatmanii]|uniref:Cytosine-specific methyltransferase n=1 Tax=Methylorubrum zatmanii TaxID=29429 RepID=A0ABW1WKH0_9HYPH|nr:DNA cytosine methyltransferase [Methylorubrum zatmanii]MBD8906919.1 DNA (cytosine-5-)-methyltransferase [Methylorubrum zatmanii]